MSKEIPSVEKVRQGLIKMENVAMESDMLAVYEVADAYVDKQLCEPMSESDIENIVKEIRKISCNYYAESPEEQNKYDKQIKELLSGKLGTFTPMSFGEIQTLCTEAFDNYKKTGTYDSAKLTEKLVGKIPKSEISGEKEGV